MTRQEVATTDEIPPGQRIIVEVNGREIGVFNVDGEFHALPNICPHQYGPLCVSEPKGTTIADEATEFQPRFQMEGEIVACPWHELEFHIPSGECLAIPEWNIQTYDLTVEDETIYLETE